MTNFFINNYNNIKTFEVAYDGIYSPFIPAVDISKLQPPRLNANNAIFKPVLKTNLIENNDIYFSSISKKVKALLDIKRQTYCKEDF